MTTIPTDEPVALSLLSGTADDPALVQVWTAYLDHTVEAELDETVASMAAVREALTWPLVCAARLRNAIDQVPELWEEVSV